SSAASPIFCSSTRSLAKLSRVRPSSGMRTVAFAMLAAAALFAPAATMAAASLGPASFSVDVVPGCPSLLECPPLHPGFLDQADFTDSVGKLGCTNPLRLFAGELVQPAGKTGPPAQAGIGVLRNVPPNTDTLATADAPFDSLAPTFALMTTGTTCR